ncbi:MAG: ankyrin repeat domain-containing protein [Caulobacterales bacterium]|nr:ankyrin repeat domain-containing protein [Caulobacterales bacterium]
MPLNKTSMQIIHLLKANDLGGLKRAFADHPEEVNVHNGIAGGTLLHHAASESSPEVVRLLVGLGFDVNLTGATRGDLPIDSAAAYANVENVRLLIALGSRLDVSEPQINPLLAAITAGRGCSEDDVIIRAPEVAEVLLRAGLDYRKHYAKQGSKGANAKEKAENWGALTIRDIIVAWERAEGAGGLPQLPLEALFYKAARAHDLAAVRSLCEAHPQRFLDGSHPDRPTPWEFDTWLHCVAVSSSPEIADYLLGKGEDIEARPREFSPLWTAARNGNLAMVRLLLDAGAKIKAREKWSPLFAAVSNDHIDVIRALLDAGANPHARSGRSPSTLDWARQNGHAEAAELMAEYC